MIDLAMRWNTLLLQQLGASREFAAAMDAQLGAQAMQLAGVDLLDGRFIVAPVDGEFEIDTKQLGGHVISAVAVDLVGPDAVAQPAVLAWLSKQRPGEPVAPGACTDPDQLQFFWAGFPADALGRYAHTHAVPAGARFPVEASPLAWPDVILSLELQALDAGAEKRLADALDAAIAAWNLASAEKIHYRGRLRAASDRVLQVHIDFGSAGPKALARMIAAVDRAFATGEVVRCTITSHLRTPG